MELEDKLKIFNRLEQELQEIEKIHQGGRAGENKDKIVSFVTELFLVIETYIHNVKESPTYKRLSKLYDDDLLINLDNILPICKGFINRLKT